jgi:DNA-binding NarL/FixJ family response regulator
LDLLWTRLEDAKLELDLAHSHMQGVNQDQVSGTVPSADSNYAYERGLKAEETATQKHLIALQDFKAALALEPVPLGPSAVESQQAITPRECEVLKLIASGMSSREIAVKLGIAFRTVVAHRYHLSTKLKAHKSADLIKAALRMGLVEL